MKKFFKAIGNFFKKIGLFIWKYLKICWNYIKENAQYGIVQETPKQTRVINTFVNTNDGGDPNKSTNTYQAFNDAIREKASR